MVPRQRRGDRLARGCPRRHRRGEHISFAARRAARRSLSERTVACRHRPSNIPWARPASRWRACVHYRSVVFLVLGLTVA